MSDKVQKIKQEIERRIEQCYRALSQDLLERERNETNCCLQQYKEILQFIDSIPEEIGCEKKDYRERYKRIVQTEQFKRSYCDKSLGKEEPESEDLEEIADNYAQQHNDLLGFDCDCEPIQTGPELKKAVIFGAEWQRKKDQETIELA